MSKPMIRIHNLETDEIIDREMDAKELAQLKVDQDNAKKEADVAAESASIKTALLEKLGITEEEAKLLFS